MPEEELLLDEYCDTCGATFKKGGKCPDCYAYKCPICRKTLYRNQVVGISPRRGYVHESCIQEE